MAWKVEFTPTARSDIDAIFEHLFQSHLGFGHDYAGAVSLAEARVREIVAAVRRIANAPSRGSRHRFRQKELRHLTINRAIYWFVLDDTSQTVRVVGVFFGGQDHLGRMLSRLTAEGGA